MYAPLDDVVLSQRCVSRAGFIFLRVHHTARYGRQDTDNKKTHQAIQVRASKCGAVYS